MNYKKIAAVLSALVITSGAAGFNSFISDTPAHQVYAEDTAAVDTLTIAYVGYTAPVSLNNTTETPQWYSDDESIATVKSTGQLTADITAVGVGTTYIYALLSNQLLKFEVIVEAEAPEESNTVELGTVNFNSQQNQASPELKNIKNTDAVWSSSDESVATVSADGTITAVGKGTCTITALYNNISYIINVVSEYDPSDIQQPTDPAEQLIGTVNLSNSTPSRKISATAPEGQTIQWSSTDTSVAVVDDEGTVTAKGSGNCRIYAVIGNFRYYAEIVSTYDPSQKIEPKDLGGITLTNEKPTFQVTLNSVPEGAEMVWSSSDESIASVDQNGLVTGISSGSCKINILINGAEYFITVDSTVTKEGQTQKEYTIYGIGNTLQLTADNFSSAPEWTSLNKKVAVVDQNGLVTAVSEGEAVIAASSGNYAFSVKIKVSAVSEILYGDANLDEKVSVADSVAILQHIALNDKYGLKGQALLNADCCNPGDGVTSKDALSILKLDANVIKSLPEK